MASFFMKQVNFVLIASSCEVSIEMKPHGLRANACSKSKDVFSWFPIDLRPEVVSLSPQSDLDGTGPPCS